MQLLIIEDEKPAARLLQRKLQHLGYHQVNVVHSVAEAEAWLATHPAPELVFMDIQLSDGTAFDVLDRTKIVSAIIFTTAFDEYTLRAFKENSIDYLLKPITEEELERAIQKYLLLNKRAVDFSEIRKALMPVDSYKNRFTVRIGQVIRIIEAKDIACFFSAQGGTYLRTAAGNNYVMDYSLEQLVQLVDSKNFFRINRSHIVQLPFISKIAIHSNSRLKIYLAGMVDNDIIVSRDRVNDFKEWLG